MWFRPFILSATCSYQSTVQSYPLFSLFCLPRFAQHCAWKQSLCYKRLINWVSNYSRCYPDIFCTWKPTSTLCGDCIHREEREILLVARGHAGVRYSGQPPPPPPPPVSEARLTLSPSLSRSPLQLGLFSVFSTYSSALL